MKNILRTTFILISLILVLSCYEKNETINNQKVRNEQKTINIQEEIKIGNTFYDKDDYINALPHLVSAFKAGEEDGIILYRIAYSFEQIYGLTYDIKNIYKYALKLLNTQYPNHKYYKYAKNKVIKFSSINKNYIAENGDIYNFDNDGDGRREPVYVRGYFRKDGTYVRGHYRAKPR